MSVETGTSAETIAKIFDVFFPDALTVLDMTYGNGKFWDKANGLKVNGRDINPDRARDGVSDFYALDDADGSFDVCVFDPPYYTDAGKESIMRKRFGSFEGMADLIEAVENGVREARRVARLGVVVKIQDHIHGNRLVMMSDMVRSAMAPIELYDIVHVTRASRPRSRRWTRQLSAWRNHSSYLVFRLDGTIHKARKTVRPIRAAPIAPGGSKQPQEARTADLLAKVHTDSPYAYSIATGAPMLPGFGNALPHATMPPERSGDNAKLDDR